MFCGAYDGILIVSNLSSRNNSVFSLLKTLPSLVPSEGTLFNEYKIDFNVNNQMRKNHLPPAHFTSLTQAVLFPCFLKRIVMDTCLNLCWIRVDYFKHFGVST